MYGSEMNHYFVSSSADPHNLRRLTCSDTLTHRLRVMGTCRHDNSLRWIRQLSLKPKTSYSNTYTHAGRQLYGHRHWHKNKQPGIKTSVIVIVVIIIIIVSIIIITIIICVW